MLTFCQVCAGPGDGTERRKISDRERSQQGHDQVDTRLPLIFGNTKLT